MTHATQLPPRRALRPYQVEAVDAVLAEFAAEKSTVVVLPTGTGKSTVIAAVASRAVGLGLRVVMLAHRRELLNQMVDAVHAVDPVLTDETGFVQGDRDEPGARVVAASFQTLANDARRRALGHVDVVLVDEVHHSPAETYAGVLDALRDDNGATFFAGFTATLERADGGLGELWETIAFERPLSWAIERGYLAPPEGKTVVLPDLDTTAVKVERGDLQSKALGAAMIASAGTTVQAIREHAAGRRMLIFGATVEHCEVLAAALNEVGVNTAVVVGSTPPDVRDHYFARFSDGNTYDDGPLDALVTVQVLTEGTDLPACDCVVLARPTRSPVLYTQVVGRALRPYPGKTSALVLDLAGSTADVSLVTLASLVPDAPTFRVAPDSDDDPGQDEPAERPGRRIREGAVDMTDYDVLGGTNVVWLSTAGGVPFVDAGDGTLGFVYDDGTGACRAGIVHSPPRPDVDGWLGGPDVTGTAEQAREAVELTLHSLGERVPLKSAPWRQRPAPSEGQVNFARRLGIPNGDDMTKARLSDTIATVLATRRLDPYLKKEPL